MIPAVRIWTQDEMRVRIAKFSELKGSLGGFADSYLPGCEREIMNVIGFQPPESDQRYVSPVGADASKNAAISISEKSGFRTLQT
jgi:TctA family transporter